MKDEQMKKALMIASMASMLENFNTNNIELLHELGYKVTLAANFEKEDSNSRERVCKFKCRMQKLHRVEQIDFTRKLSNIKGHVKSYQQVKKLAEEDFGIIHCHSPICAAITRIAFRKKRKTGTKVIYTAHGFHFYKGAPLKNWLLFFPVEWACSYWTDILITINREDYIFAKRHLQAKKVRYVPGIGVELERFQGSENNREITRKELGIKQKDSLILSVGELNQNKNHEMMIRVIAEIGDKKIHYAVAGQGSLYEELKKLSEKLGIQQQIHLLGYQNNVIRLYQCADLYVLPSMREGLNVSLMEAMASGLPVVCSKIRGNVDLIVQKKGGFLCKAGCKDAFAEAIKKIYKDKKTGRKMGKFNKARIEKFGYSNVGERMRQIYGSVE